MRRDVALVVRARQRAGPRVEQLDRGGAGVDLHAQEPRGDVGDRVQQGGEQPGVAVHHRLRGRVVPARPALDEVAGQRERRPGEAEQGRGTQRVAGEPDGLGEEPEVGRREGGERVDVGGRADGRAHDGAGAGDDVDVDPGRVQRHDDVAVEHGGVDAVAAHGLQGDLGDELRGAAGLEHRRRPAGLLVLRQRAPRLAHEPHGRALDGLASGGADQVGGAHAPDGVTRADAPRTRPRRSAPPGVGRPTFRGDLHPVLGHRRPPCSTTRSPRSGRPGAPGGPTDEIPAPRRVAPFAHAVEGHLDLTSLRTGTGAADEDEVEEAGGRFVLLHDPDRPEAWDSDLRVIALVKAVVEPELAEDPMLAEVVWAWLGESLVAPDAPAHRLGGTVTRVVSESFGSLADRPPPSRSSSGPRGRRWARWTRSSAPGPTCCAGSPGCPRCPWASPRCPVAAEDAPARSRSRSLPARPMTSPARERLPA